MDAVADDNEREALNRALRIGALLLVVYGLVTAGIDWSYLLDPERARFSAQQAVDALLALPTAPPAEAYQRLYVLVTCAATSLCAALVIAMLSIVQAREGASRAQGNVAIAVIALVCVMISLPAHMPFLMPHTEAFRPNGTVVTQAEYSRAYRDAITYVWSSTLLLAIPIVASPKIDKRSTYATTLVAVVAVLAAYLPHMAHKGSRTDNELIIFVFALLSVSYLSGRVRRALEREASARAQAESALQEAQSERTRYAEQSQAAIGEFRAIRQRLEVREERRTAFLAAAAHDLRQPLTATTLYADLLAQAMKQGSATPANSVDAQRYLHVLRAEIASLATAFDAILDYSQIESGKLAADVQGHRLRDVFVDLERRFTPIATERQLSICFTVPPRGCIVQTDKVLLTRLLSNLLSNAVRFTAVRRGPRPRQNRHDVLVRTRIRGLLATIYVIDQGCGIPPGMQESIFEAGVQIDNPQRDRHEGFGLGLATVRSIVDRAMPDHGVRLKSIVDRGTHLMVDVPLAFAEPAAEPAPDEPSSVILLNRLEGAMIVVVEDDDSLRQGIAETLRRAGAFVLEARNLSEAAECVETADRFPDIILTDYRLPHEATGRSVIEAVRHRCGGREVPALVLTADHLAAEHALRDMAGVEVLRKPIDRKALLRRLAAHYESAPSPLDILT